MDLSFSPEDEAFRTEVREFLDTHLTEDLRRAASKDDHGICRQGRGHALAGHPG